ncbi:unnamed protein product, partial [Linum tenue]
MQESRLLVSSIAEPSIIPIPFSAGPRAREYASLFFWFLYFQPRTLHNLDSFLCRIQSKKKDHRAPSSSSIVIFNHQSPLSIFIFPSVAPASVIFNRQSPSALLGRYPR